nr:fatty acyl-CoA reductase wat-like [Leptinotarsa decemlineata]
MYEMELQACNNNIGEKNFELTEIQEFYNDANIFITGSTGFLGKILLEKLLRSCPHISTLYLLVRNKKGNDMDTRVNQIFDDNIFDLMKKERPKFRHKIVGISGDCSLPDLGLSMQDRKLLMDEVNIIFHVAATVRFDEKLKTAVAINVRASQEMLLLAHQMPKLKSYIHVSTAFSNCTSKIIEEKFQPTSIDYKTLIIMSETLSDKMMDSLTPIILNKYPNTYAFTKQIAEDVVRQCGAGLPVGVTRPSIVVSTYKEPIRAWINNMYGATGVVTGAGVGLVRTLHCDPDSNANIIPVDMCVNSMISTAWDVCKQFQEAKQQGKNFEIPIYNYESSCSKPITWRYFMDSSIRYGMITPTVKAIWYFSLGLQKYYIPYLLSIFFLHTLPAAFIDGILLLLGKSPKMSKAYRKIHKFTNVISYFATRSWTFRSENAQKLCDKMSHNDKELFFSDLRKLDWDDFFQYYLQGVRIHLLNDPIETLEQAQIKWRRLYWLHQFVKTIVGLLLMVLLWFIVSYLFSQ